MEEAAQAQALTPVPVDQPVFTARLLAVNTTTNRAQVSLWGSEAVWLPYVPGVYTGVTTVFVTRSPGFGHLVTGPCYAETDVLPPPPPAAPEPTAPATEVDTALIRPTGSGTYRVIRSAWDRWNLDRHGGASTLYQGDAFGSGTLIGLATYGSQITALGALEITSMVVSTPVATGSGSVVLQGSPHASRPSGAPSSSGTTASGTTSVSLPADVREGFRTGTYRGLCAVGGSYRGTRGVSLASGMAVSITYRRPA